MALRNRYNPQGLTKCRDCIHHKPITGIPNLNYKGEPFLCTCEFLPEGWTRQMMDHLWFCRDFQRK